MEEEYIPLSPPQKNIFVILDVPYQLKAEARKINYFDPMNRNSTPDFLNDTNFGKTNEPQIVCRKCLEEQEWQAVCLAPGALSHS